MDEADKLLSPEFTPVMEQLLSFLPTDRQVMLFSATFPMIVKDFKVGLPRVLPLLPVFDLFSCVGQTHENSLRDQSYGGAYLAWCYAVLRLCRGATEGPLLEHPFL
jgi:ATP-dependent RNA helicase DDX6/DHH1